jgi:predicted nucleotidyltransferase
MPSRFQQILEMVLQEFGQRVLAVTMFGSRVKGGARSDSDYDMIIIMEQGDPNPNVRDEFVASAVANILLTSGIRISPLVLSREEATSEAKAGSPLLSSVLSSYEILYDPTRFMAELFDLTKRSRSSLTYIERGQAWNLARTV